MNIFSPAAVAAKIAQLRARPDSEYTRLCIAGWMRWLGKLKEADYEMDLEDKEPFINIH